MHGRFRVCQRGTDGKGVDIDLDKAVEWFGKAVDNGWFDSNNELPRVTKLAEQMNAAKAGDSGAQADVADEMRGIGKLLENRNDDPQRAYAESLAWAIRATEANNPKGMRILAMAYQLGRGTEKDSEKGLALLQKGCDMNDTDCMVALAETYLNGEGVERSLDSAREWLTKAKNLGNDNATELLNKLSGEGMEPDELMNMAVRAAIISLASGKTPDQVAEDIGLDSGTVSIINAIRLLRGFKRPDENVDDPPEDGILFHECPGADGRRRMDPGNGAGRHEFAGTDGILSRRTPGIVWVC